MYLCGHFFDWDVLNCESQDDGPNHTKGHLKVAIHNFLCTDGDQLHTWKDKAAFTQRAVLNNLETIKHCIPDIRSIKI